MKKIIRKNILVFGYFGYQTDKLNGQTIKTRSIYEMLLTHSEFDTYCADTEQFRYSIKSVCNFVRRLFSCDRLVYIPAHGNLKYLFPIVYIASYVLHFQVVYVAVGGWLPEFLRNLPVHRYFLKRVKVILMQNNYAVTQLRDLYGFQNAGTIPNFRGDTVSGFQPHIRHNGEPLRLVFMARINKKKGLDTIAEVAERINRTYPEGAVSINFYGQINEPDRTYFEEDLVNKYSFVRYLGVLQPERIVSTLCQYDAMIPVIASKWKYATEFVDDGKTGYIVSFENPVEEIANCISRIYSNVSLLSELKRNAYKESLRYTPEAAWEILNPFLL